MNSRLEHVEEWINNLKDRVVEITWSEQQKDKRMKIGTSEATSSIVIVAF